MRDALARWLLLHVPFLILFAYSLHGVGLCCDDFELVVRAPSEPWFGYLLANPANIPTHGLPLLWIGYEHLFLYDVLKFAWVALGYAMAYRFGSLFFPAPRAALFAALFVGYPAHDSTSFWFTTQYLLLTASFYMYAFYLASRGRLTAAAAMATLGSFVSYGSTPWALGLGLVFVLRRQWRRAAVLLVPNLVYIAYYAAVTLGLERGNRRLPQEIHAGALLKQFVLQIAGGADAVLGPSLWIKVWYSIGAITLVSAAVGAAVVVALACRPRARADETCAPSSARARLPASVWLGVAAVAFAGFAMFALTGAYPQAAFGMGNRVAIYASFSAAFALVYLASRVQAATALSAVFVFSLLGLSDHWRAWRVVQDRTIEAVRRNPELAAGRLGTDILFVTGNAYSQLGPIAHIAFLAQRSIADPVFRIALGERKSFRVVPLNSRFLVEPDALVDSKDSARYAPGPSVAVYDAQAGELHRIEIRDMPRFVAGLKPPVRHWIQLAGLDWARNLILRWMPQLAYLWH